MSLQIPTRKLGKYGPQVTALGFGAMGLSAYYGKPKPDEERLQFLDYVFASGERMWDTAWTYGDNEELIGKWFQKTGKRNEVFLATKFAVATTPEGERVIRNDPEYIHEACDISLSRLQTDHIDLYYAHRVDVEQPIEITVKAMAELKEAGKIKFLGLSECSADTLRRACTVHHIAALQVEFSPFFMDIEDEQIGLLKACRELGVAVVAYSPLGRGFLTGSIKTVDDFDENDFRRTVPKFNAENLPKSLELVDSLEKLAKEKSITTGQLVLAFLMAQGPDIIPIPGTTKKKNFDENMKAMHIELSEEDMKKIREAIKKTEVPGLRYPERMMRYIFADTPPLKGIEER